MKKILNRIFDKKSISGCGEVGISEEDTDSAYMHRWRLLALTRGRRLYLHHFFGNDWSEDYHNHPKAFISIGLWGSYVEHQLTLAIAGEELGKATAPPRYIINRRTFKAPWIRRFGPNHAHRVDTAKSCWTLVYVGPRVQPWGFFREGKWIPYRTYLKNFGLGDCK